MCLRSRWGSISDEEWSAEDAQVVCTQLGFSAKGSLIHNPIMPYLHNIMWTVQHVCYLLLYMYRYVVGMLKLATLHVQMYLGMRVAGNSRDRVDYCIHCGNSEIQPWCQTFPIYNCGGRNKFFPPLHNLKCTH